MAQTTTFLLCLSALFVGAICVHAGSRQRMEIRSGRGGLSVDSALRENLAAVGAGQRGGGRRGSRVDEALGEIPGPRRRRFHPHALDRMAQHHRRGGGGWGSHRMTMMMPGAGRGMEEGGEMMGRPGARRWGGGGSGSDGGGARGINRAAEHLRREAGRGHHDQSALMHDARGNLNRHLQHMRRVQGHGRRGQGRAGFHDLARFEAGMQRPGRVDQESHRGGNLNWASGGHRFPAMDFRGHRHQPMTSPRGGHRFMIGSHRRGYGMGPA